MTKFSWCVCEWRSSAPLPNMNSETSIVCSWMLFSQSAAWKRGKSVTHLLSCRGDQSPRPEQSCGWKQFEFSEGQCGKVLCINLYHSPWDCRRSKVKGFHVLEATSLWVVLVTAALSFTLYNPFCTETPLSVFCVALSQLQVL